MQRGGIPGAKITRDAYARISVTKQALITPYMVFGTKEQPIEFTLMIPDYLPSYRKELLWPLGAAMGKKSFHQPYHDIAVELSKKFFPGHYFGEHVGVMPGDFTRKKGKVIFEIYDDPEPAEWILFYSNSMLNWCCGLQNFDMICIPDYGIYLAVIPINRAINL